MYKYISRIVIFLVLLWFVIPLKIEAENKVNLYYFWGDGCFHCKQLREVLNELEEEHPELVIHEYEVWYNKDNQELLVDVGNLLNENISAIPFIVIGNNTFSGFSPSETKNQLKKAIEYYRTSQCRDVVGERLGIVEENPNYSKYCDFNKDVSRIDIPFLGSLNLSNLSLPVITIIFGIVDGFNPCAMWVLLFLISTLFGMKDKKRMWILGLVFIFTSSVMYYLFMSAWLNLMLFIGALLWIRLLVGCIAVTGGSLNIKSYFDSKDDGCKVVGSEKKKRIFDRIRKFTSEQNLLFSVVGIIFLAVSVNLIELVCSAGLPVVYIQILTLNNISGFGYYWYLLLYVLFFMLDDILVFSIAMITFKLTGVSTKYAKISHLIGGILMIIIGVLLVFRPEWLMLG